MPGGSTIPEGLPTMPEGLPATYLPAAEAIETSGREVPGQVQQVITELCSIRAYTADELAVLLGEKKSGCSGISLCFALEFLSIRLPRIPGTRCRRTGRRSEMG